LSGTDAIVISHGHYDHAGGLSDALDIAANAKIYFHPLATESKFSRKKSNVKYIGMSESTKKAIKSRNAILTEKPANLFPGMVITGQIPRINDFEDVGEAFYLDENCLKTDDLLDDQAMFIESDKGLIVILGCAHSGVVNILDYISSLTGCKKIYAVIGGMHLLNANHNRIENIIKAFRKYEIQKIMPMHCTGQKAMEILKNIFEGKCIFLGAGDKISF
jgi:7,8-dihydropterin-6-yl-methyl-4-(beta-D-ribofuranosyl)aminobenzene 5'-phosphate synthase